MNCPFCGQKRAASLRFGPSLHFECGTALCASHIKRHFQSTKCAQAEIKNLNARIARLEEASGNLLSALGRDDEEDITPQVDALREVLEESMEPKPKTCMYCMQSECDCSDFDVDPGMGAK